MKEISLHILDIVQNSIAAKASRVRIEIVEDAAQDKLSITIADDGCGMDAQMLERVRSPFATTRTTRKVGMGIPLFMAGALACEGQFDIQSAPGSGTTVKAVYKLSHIDRPPIGDMAGTLLMMVLSNPQVIFVYHHVNKDTQSEFTYDGAAILEVLDGVALDDPEISGWLREYIAQGIQGINKGA